MNWWNYQKNFKKILFAGAFISLAAGVSARGSGVIGGVLMFIIFFALGILLPDKRLKTPEEKEWNYLISPHYPKKEKRIHLYLSVVAIFLILVDIYFLFDSLIKNNYILIFVCSILLIILFTSWLLMNPKYYNEVYLTKKIIPIKGKTTTQEFYNRVSGIKTPFGTPLLGFVPGKENVVAVFRLVDIFWAVYYYVENDEIHIQAESLKEENFNPNDVKLVYQFTQDLANLFCFIENTNSLPEVDEIAKIFKNLES